MKLVEIAEKILNISEITENAGAEAYGYADADARTNSVVRKLGPQV